MEIIIAKIGQIAIPVTDITRSIAFYRDILNLKFLFEAPPSLAFFDCDGIRIMLDGPAKSKAGTGSVIYFKVNNIRDSFEKLKVNGVLFNSEPHLIAKMPDHELWMAFFLDPDKNQLALMSELR